MNATAIGFLALLLVVGTGTAWFRALGRVQLPKNRAGFVAAMLLAAALGVVALSQGVGWLGGVPASLAIFAGSFFALLVAISRQIASDQAIAVGSRIPPFSALDENGETFEASSLSGHPVLIKFFRGHW